ncbi:MAG: hypothetical protein HYV29_14580 [Ignavibacteriales bacterium]|nr:hypothetical protein [Ignavibacteriales bacterium]
MTTSSYTPEQERLVNNYLKKILDVLGYHIPDDHYGSVDISVPKQNGKIAGEIEVSFRSKLRRVRTES